MEKQESFFRSEDFWVISIGAVLLLSLLVAIYTNVSADWPGKIAALETTQATAGSRPFKTVAWHRADAELKAMKASALPVGKFLKKISAAPNGWTARPADAIWKPASQKTLPESPDRLEKLALQAEAGAASADFGDSQKNAAAETAISTWLSAKTAYEKAKSAAKPGHFSLLHTLGLFTFLLLVFGVGARAMGERFWGFAKGFTVVFLLSLVAMVFASQKDMKDFGIEYAVWAIVLGMLISNTDGTPKWVMPALKTELFIKTGLIVMGAEVLFNKMVAIGLPGIFVAWVVTPVVLVSTFWFGQNVLKIASKSLNITISADMSVCGVSAAVATAAASRATREELTVAIGLSMVFTAIMMVVMPIFIKFVGMPEVLGGAWIGGTIDSSGAVVAAGAALGDKAMYVAATIKMIQNVLIGFVAFGVAIYFAAKVDKQAGRQIGASEIWRRFPKFIFGFLGASLLFTAIYSALGERMAYSIIDEGVLAISKNLRTWLFCLAFASIGLSTNFRELRSHFTGGKPLLLYVCGQLLNLLLTLGMAYLMFYIVFPDAAADL